MSHIFGLVLRRELLLTMVCRTSIIFSGLIMSLLEHRKWLFLSSTISIASLTNAQFTVETGS